VVTDDGDEELPEELEELLDDVVVAALELDVVVPELELEDDVVAAARSFSRSRSRFSAAARSATARFLAAAAASLDDDVVPLVRAAATCFVVALFADSAGSLPSTICTKIPSHAAMNTATVIATTVRRMRRALRLRSRMRARASALPVRTDSMVRDARRQR
jgi:hypothetical protein